MSNAKLYEIPLKWRKMENLHILFWLMKDICWCIIFKPVAIVMIFPTLIISIVIAYRTRHNVAELAHNLAITFWITANSYWMISEFMGIDTQIAFAGITFKSLALIPFLSGLMVLVWYYLYYAPRHKESEPVESV